MLAIRAAVAADFAAVRAFYDHLIDAMHGAPYPPGWEKGLYPTDAFLRGSIRRRELHLGESGGAAAAAMVLNHQCAEGYERVDWAVSAAPEEITLIHALGVAPALQGQGLARQLVEAALSTARAGGQRAVRLDVLGTNLPAQRLYTSLGFQHRATLKLFYEDTGLTDYLLYEYPL